STGASIERRSRAFAGSSCVYWERTPVSRVDVVIALAIGFAIAASGCREQHDPVIVAAGAGFTASCNGDFPSWISANPPTADPSGDVNPSEPGVQHSFELAQAYPLGIPVFNGANLDHYDPPQ